VSEVTVGQDHWGTRFSPDCSWRRAAPSVSTPERAVSLVWVVHKRDQYS